jgi:hypothetical protein
VKINHVRRFKKKDGENTIELNTVAVHFQATELPLGVYLYDNLHYRVGKFKQRPLQCKKCNRYGHIERFCRNSSQICQYCSESHNISECNKYKEKREPVCALCKESHEANSKQCKVYIKASKELSANPFPKLKRNSIKEPRVPKWSQTLKEYTKTFPTLQRNQFDSLENEEYTDRDRVEETDDEECMLAEEPPTRRIPTSYRTAAMTPSQPKETDDEWFSPQPGVNTYTPNPRMQIPKRRIPPNLPRRNITPEQIPINVNAMMKYIEIVIQRFIKDMMTQLSTVIDNAMKHWASIYIHSNGAPGK